MKKWEYTVRDLTEYRLKEQQEKLDRWGKEGWELVAVTWPLAYLKKEIPDAPETQEDHLRTVVELLTKIYNDTNRISGFK